jgi:hypothetical protein
VRRVDVNVNVKISYLLGSERVALTLVRGSSNTGLLHQQQNNLVLLQTFENKNAEHDEQWGI